jgi:hypothetical protein
MPCPRKFTFSPKGATIAKACLLVFPRKSGIRAEALVAFGKPESTGVPKVKTIFSCEGSEKLTPARKDWAVTLSPLPENFSFSPVSSANHWHWAGVNPAKEGTVLAACAKTGAGLSVPEGGIKS